ncbi:hypothetical protein LCGC14_1192000 [marine sediment metagenome]|uniref:histidine kinase n=1 Tax=marine sediment metagenome TaxID=412755 RepID=A0A0F9M6W5_9ZZZZ
MEEETCLFLDKEELEILLTSVDLVKDFNHLSKESAILNKLIKKINLCLQYYIDEDLTSQKEFSTQKFFESTTNELISLFNKAKEPITISIDENIKYANSAFCKMLGYESENEIIELGLFNLISKRCLPKIKDLHDKRSKGEIVPNIHDLELKQADGEIITIECVHYAMPFNKSYFIISFYIGLTKILSLEKKLRKSEKKYRELYENAPNAYFSIGTDKSIRRCNTSAIKLLGYNHEELQQMKVFDLYAEVPDGLPKAEKIFQHFIKGEKIQDEELVMKHKNGNLIWISLSVKPIKNQVGEVIESHSIVINITERKKAEDILNKSESKYRSLFENTMEGIALHDIVYDSQNKAINYIIKDVNPQFEILLSIKKEDVINKKATEAYQVDEPPYLDIYSKVAETMKPTYFENYFPPMDKHFSISVFSPKKGRFVTVFEDITERKISEVKLKESEEKYFNAYNRVNFYKDLFAHDINNILNNILSAVELSSLFLNDPEKMEKLERVEELIALVENQGRRGAKLISDVRKLSQIEEHEILLKSMETCKILKKAMEFTKNSSLKENIDIQVEFTIKEFSVKANELLFDVFENILNNATKYNDNSQIEIIIKITKLQKQEICYIKIEFLDNGIGIQDERKESIFQRAYNKDLSVRGMGFGLSLVKKIIESFKGEIWIEDRVKGDYTKGSNFVILIPEDV